MAVAAGGSLSSWDGRALTEGQNNVWMRRPGESVWVLDLTIGSGNGERWIYRRDPLVVRSWKSAVLRNADDIPYLAPDLQLLFKSKAPRAKDYEDAQVVIPLLGAEARSFLRSNLPGDHPWQELLAST
jgi:hypothetical protein